MNLEIFSYGDALKYIPKDKTYAIRIFNDITVFPKDLQSSDDWIKINNYRFDDIWSNEWKEYSWLDSSEPIFSNIFEKSWREMILESPKITWDSFIGLLEYNGHPKWKTTLFNERKARNILEDYEKVKDYADTVVIHCNRGQNRSPAVGIAMNEIYGWGIEGLKEKFPNYRKFVYNILKNSV